MRIALFIVLLAGCKASMDNRPIHGGGGDDDTTTGGPDATTDSTISGNSIAGRACLITTDSRDLTTCATTGAGGLTVSLGAALVTQATTAADGTFTIGVPAGSDLTWHVVGPTTGTQFQPSLMSATVGNVIPVFRADDYATLLTDNISTTLEAGQGSIFVSVVHAATGLPASGATAISSDTTVVPFYDAATKNTWNQGNVSGTGAFGMVWFPATTVGAATVTITPSIGATAVPFTMPVEDQTITFYEAGI